MAVHIRTLVHDTKKSASILSQMTLKHSLRFANTADPINPGNMLPTIGPIIMQIGPGGASYVPPLDDPGRPYLLPREPFSRWWTSAIVKDNQGNLFSRRDLVLALANKEGGAHLDPESHDAYDAIAKSNSLGWMFTGPTGNRPLDQNPVLAIVRQIAHELLRTLEQPEYEPVSRNEPCPCGSGMKFKRCHGAPATKIN